MLSSTGHTDTMEVLSSRSLHAGQECLATQRCFLACGVFSSRWVNLAVLLSEHIQMFHWLLLSYSVSQVYSSSILKGVMIFFFFLVASTSRQI